MRKLLIVCCLLLALSSPATTPELGKDKLRNLIKLPTIHFRSSWAFDAERGFILGSNEHEVSNRIAALRLELKHNDSDAEACLHIAELYSAINHSDNARSSFTQAATLYRRRVELQPDDPTLLAGFGRALQGAGKKSEAESVLRKAVRIAPKESKCWIALGRFLDAGRANRPRPIHPRTTIRPHRHRTKSLPPRLPRRKNGWRKPGIVSTRRSPLAPEETETYFRRAMHRSLHNMMLNEIRLASGEQKQDVDVLADYFSPEGLADLQHASRLDAKNYRLLGNTILYEIYTACARKGQVNWREFSWNSLPDKSQRSIREELTRLENLAEIPTPKSPPARLKSSASSRAPSSTKPAPASRICAAPSRSRSFPRPGVGTDRFQPRSIRTLR